MYRWCQIIRFSKCVHCLETFACQYSTQSAVKQTSTQQKHILKDNDGEDDHHLTSLFSSSYYIDADSKSKLISGKNKNKNKQKQQRQPLSQTTKLVADADQFGTLSGIDTDGDKEFFGDTFVTDDGLIVNNKYQPSINNDDDGINQEELDEPRQLAIDGRRFPIWYYASKLRSLGTTNKVQEALDYFYKTIMDKERVAPNMFCYQVVIGVCARNGYLSQAFQLYREMKDRGFNGMYTNKMSKIFTLLATACYRSSDKHLSIDYATKLIDDIKEKGYSIQFNTYNALISAFGKHGDLKRAFQLADEMVELGWIPNHETYVALLIACGSEPTDGLRYAIEIWRRMLTFRIRPTVFHFGLLLRAVHHCGLGSQSAVNELLVSQPHHPLLKDDDRNTNQFNQLTIEYSQPSSSFFSYLIPSSSNETVTTMSIEEDQTSKHASLSSISSNNNNSKLSITDDILEPMSYEILNKDDIQADELLKYKQSEWWQSADDIRSGQITANQLQPFGDASILKSNVCYKDTNIVGLTLPKTPAERLMLLGGIPGILKHMKECNVQPNIIIFNHFLELLPLINEHEHALLHVMKMCEVKPTLQFFNILILRRLRRRSLKESKEVIELMRDYCITPDIYTFSALAKGCLTKDDSAQLLIDMQELNLKPNQYILGSMLQNAFNRDNFPYMSFICNAYRTYDLAVHPIFLKKIENYLLRTRSRILALERQNVQDEKYNILNATYNRFQKFYDHWLKSIPYQKRYDQKVTFMYDKPKLK